MLPLHDIYWKQCSIFLTRVKQIVQLITHFYKSHFCFKLLKLPICGLSFPPPLKSSFLIMICRVDFSHWFLEHCWGSLGSYVIQSTQFQQNSKILWCSESWHIKVQYYMGRPNLKKKKWFKNHANQHGMAFLGYVNSCSATERKKDLVAGYRLRIFIQNYRKVPFQYFSIGLYDIFNSCEQKYIFRVNKCMKPRRINWICALIYLYILLNVWKWKVLAQVLD